MSRSFEYFKKWTISFFSSFHYNITTSLFAYSCVSEYSKRFLFSPSKNFNFLRGKGPPPLLEDMSSRNERFFLTAPLTKASLRTSNAKIEYTYVEYRVIYANTELLVIKRGFNLHII